MKVTLVDSMGTDLSVVNAARVSFSKQSDWENRTDVDENYYGPDSEVQPKLSKQDEGLIKFLARGCTSKDWDNYITDLHNARFEKEHTEELVRYLKKMPEHWTPFGHTAITLHIKVPIFVARQLGKHQVGMVWNEVSRRYVDDEPEFYVPEVWRKKAENVKQGSSEEAVNLKSIVFSLGDGVTDGNSAIDWFYEDVSHLYGQLLEAGVCPEQARMVLPQSMYTEWYWTGNLYGFANVYNLRTDSHTQKETRDLVHQFKDIIEPLFPVSWSCLVN